MQTTTRQRFTDAIRNFMRASEVSGHFSPKARAREFLDREEKLARLFLLEETEQIMRAEERREARASRARADNPYQMFLPGFTSLDERLPLKTGKIQLAQATVTALEETLVVMRDKVAKHPGITRVEALIEGMRPYISDYPRLTVERYCELRAASVDVTKATPAKTKVATS
jgi:hypothetical protein